MDYHGHAQDWRVACADGLCLRHPQREPRVGREGRLLLTGYSLWRKGDFVGATCVALSIGTRWYRIMTARSRRGRPEGRQIEEQGNGAPQRPMEMKLGNNPDKDDTVPWNSSLDVGAGVSFQKSGRVHSSGKMGMWNMSS